MTAAPPPLEDVVGQALADLGFMHVRFQGLFALAGRLDELHALMASEREKRELLDDLDRQAAAVRDVISQGDAAQERLDKISIEVDRHLTEARAEASRIVDEAESAARNTAQQAKLAAQKIVDDARLSAAKIIQDGRAKAEAEAEKHGAEARKRFAQISALDADIAQLSVEKHRLRQGLDDDRLRAGVA
jgi:vacuolar-type H+-ATPase subunit H